MTTGEWIALATPVAAVVGGMLALFTYMRDVRHKQTDWLYQLFEKFYEKPTYKTIRRLLDKPSADTVAAIEADLSAPGISDQEEALVDYLNFFEFICNLLQDRRMKRHDVNALFDYYLEQLAMLPFVIAYVGANGFEALDKELRRRRADK